MANEPIIGSNIVCAVDSNGDPIRIAVDESFTPPRLIVELPDRALRDLGVVTADGTVSVSGTVVVSATDLDIRDLTATDVVTVTGGAGQTADVKITLDSEAVVLGAGSAAVGKLAANSGVDIGDVDVTSLPATAPVTLVSVAIAASSSGDNQLVAADASNKIKVVAFALSFSGTVNAKFQSAATDLTGLFYGVANAGAGNSISPPSFLFATATNEALDLNLSGAVAVGGFVTYYKAAS